MASAALLAVAFGASANGGYERDHGGGYDKGDRYEHRDHRRGKKPTPYLHRQWVEDGRLKIVVSCGR